MKEQGLEYAIELAAAEAGIPCPEECHHPSNHGGGPRSVDGGGIDGAWTVQGARSGSVRSAGELAALAFSEVL